MNKKLKNTIYVTHVNRWMKAEGPYSYVKVCEDKMIHLRHVVPELPDYIILDRNHARLLARRLLQALEDSK